jgi:ribonuclease BN (tRNA processing enzyme)
MRLTVLGACGAWPEPGQARSGFLVEQDGFRLVVDLGYATVPRLLELLDAAQVDAVVISHGHPDHCADLNPLLRARATRDDPAPLPVYAPAGALDAVLRLDQGRRWRARTRYATWRRGRAWRSGRYASRPGNCRTGCRTSACGWQREAAR